MDARTINRYDQNTLDFLNEWPKETPEALRQLILKWFTPGAKVCDVGCGGGRDVAWLRTQGFRSHGVDASTGLLDAARKCFPQDSFARDTLPDLNTLDSDSFDHVLCSAVLMHLPREELSLAITHLLRVIKVGGRLICSVRPSTSDRDREDDGRLFMAISAAELAERFTAQGGRVLEMATTLSEAGGKTWHTVVIEKMSQI